MEKDRLQSEQSAASAEVNLLDLVEDVNAVVWEADPVSFDFLFVNRRAVELLGYERAEWYEPEFWCARLIYPPDRAQAVATCRAAVSEKRDHQVEYRAVGADGRIVWLRDRIRVVLAPDGSVEALRGIMLDITAEKQVQQQHAQDRLRLEELAQQQDQTLDALRGSEERFRALASNASDAIITVDQRDTIRFANPATAELFGYPLEDLIGRELTSLMPDEYRDRHRSAIGRVIRTGERRIAWNGVELEGLHASGRRMPLWISFGRSEHEGEPYFTGFIRDLTERYAAEQALKESDQRFRDLADHIPQVFWIADPDGSPLYVSPAYARIWGRELDAHADWASSIHPEDRDWVLARYGERDRPRELEYRIVWPDGTERWILDRAYPIRAPDGALERIVGTAEDITDWKNARNRLETAEAHYRRLVSTSPYAVYVLDVEGRFTEVNPAAEEILGRTSDAVLGRHFLEVIAEEGMPLAGEAFSDVIAGTAERFEVELPIRRPSGEIRTLLIAAAPIRSGEETLGLHGIARDITQEQARDAQRRLLEAALDNLPDAVSITSQDLRFLYVNPAHAALLGYDLANMPATIEQVLPDEASRVQVDEIQAALRSDRRWSGRMRRRRPDGSTVVVSTTVFAVHDGTQENALAVMRDATEEITREQHLRRVERLASLGTLIGGVAHELNNPLTAVVGFAHLMLLDERSPEDRATLETMAREAERAAKIVADLRVVARDTQQAGNGERETVDLNDIIQHVLKVRRYALDTRNIVVMERLAPDLPRLHANRAQLEQVVVNLVVNAEQALERAPEGRRELVLRTRASVVGVTLHVVDNGPGIRREHLERIFDPFFTTKPPGEGTGLGLSLVHSIVTDHGGSLRVESEPRGGAEFVVDLPAVEDQLETGASPGDAGAVAAGAGPTTLRILVVDDEASIRGLLARSLRKRGHVVTEACEGEEALRMIDDPDAGFDVIVSDVRMPGLGGDQLLARLRQSHPRLARRVVFITGDPTTVGGQHSATDTDVPVVMKPFQLAEVARVIEARAQEQDATTSSG